MNANTHVFIDICLADMLFQLVSCLSGRRQRSAGECELLGNDNPVWFDNNCFLISNLYFPNNMNMLKDTDYHVDDTSTFACFCVVSYIGTYIYE